MNISFLLFADTPDPKSTIDLFSFGIGASMTLLTGLMFIAVKSKLDLRNQRSKLDRTQLSELRSAYSEWHSAAWQIVSLIYHTHKALLEGDTSTLNKLLPSSDQLLPILKKAEASLLFLEPDDDYAIRIKSFLKESDASTLRAVIDDKEALLGKLNTLRIRSSEDLETIIELFRKRKSL